MRKNILITIVLLIIFSGASFGAGFKYAQSRRSARAGFNNFLNPNSGAEGLSDVSLRAGGFRRQGNGQTGVNFIEGEIITKDETSFTLKLPNGGSKIIFFSTSTPILKSTASSAAELQSGSKLMVNGVANEDGSLSAQSIQIRATVTK